VTFDKNVCIGIFSVKFAPAIHYDNRALRLDLLKKAMGQIKDSLGEYVINGSTVYACYKQGLTKDIINVMVHDAGTDYQMTFEKRRTINLGDIHNPDQKKAAVPFGFLNNLIKAFLMKLEDIEIGKSKKYYNHKIQEARPSAGVCLYQN